MKILVACEFSGTVREAFKAVGHDATSCDLLPTEITGNHYQGNVLDILEENWDLLIAHPPCTYLANSGVSWLHKNPSRWDLMREGAEFFRSLLTCNIPRKCIENPIQHKYAQDIIQQNYTQIIHPWMFGHKETKATCLWLENLPPLKATNSVYNETMSLAPNERQKLHYLPPTKDRWKIRSKTYAGVAQAMALQWGSTNNPNSGQEM